jgi:integrase
MPLTVIRRKSTGALTIVGTVAGTRIRLRAQTNNPKLASEEAAALEADLLRTQWHGAATPPQGKLITFEKAAALYQAFRRPKLPEQKRLVKVVDALGHRRVTEITHADLVAAANKLFPGGSPSSLNRNFMDVAAAVLHYAASNGYCEWMRVKKFAHPRPLPRAARIDAIETLINATEGRRQLLLIWLWHQGMRISQTINLTWDDIDLERGTVRFFDAKGPRWRTFPLHEAVFARLRQIPAEKRAGRVFPWSNRHNVYRWLRPLVRELGVTFTPHMARHALGTALNAQGAGLRTIMGALGHDDARSSMRYQAAEIEVVRAVTAKTPRLKIAR